MVASYLSDKIKVYQNNKFIQIFLNGTFSVNNTGQTTIISNLGYPAQSNIVVPSHHNSSGHIVIAESSIIFQHSANVSGTSVFIGTGVMYMKQ